MTDVVTALGHRFEASVATLLESLPGVTIVRRCADLAELLSVVEAGVGEVAVVGADLRGLDLAAVSRLRTRGVRVIGLVVPDDEASERRLRQLSFSTVLSFEATGPELGAAIVDERGSAGPDDLEGLFDPAEAGGSVEPSAPGPGGPGPSDRPVPIGDGPVGSHGHSSAPSPPVSRRPGEPSSGAVDDAGQQGWTPAGSHRLLPNASGGGQHGVDDSLGTSSPQGSVDSPAPARATVIAVWGPAGSPGRTTVATSLAAEIAGRGTEVLLLDADTYGGCVAQTLGLLDEAPGIAAACRAADQGTLDVATLARLAPTVTPRFRVLTGLPKAERWPEVRASALERVIELSRALVPIVVVDCGFCLENDEELSYDTAAPRRNEATLTALAGADIAIAVSGADPIALQRFVRGLQELGSVPSPPPTVVVNRVRSSAVGSKPRVRIAESLHRFAGLESVRFVPDDPATVDAAVLSGRSIVEQAPDSALRSSFADLATAVAPWTSSRRTSGRRRWGRPPRTDSPRPTKA